MKRNIYDQHYFLMELKRVAFRSTSVHSRAGTLETRNSFELLQRCSWRLIPQSPCCAHGSSRSNLSATRSCSAPFSTLLSSNSVRVGNEDVFPAPANALPDHLHGRSALCDYFRGGFHFHCIRIFEYISRWRRSFGWVHCFIRMFL